MLQTWTLLFCSPVSHIYIYIFGSVICVFLLYHFFFFRCWRLMFCVLVFFWSSVLRVWRMRVCVVCVSCVLSLALSAQTKLIPESEGGKEMSGNLNFLSYTNTNHNGGTILSVQYNLFFFQVPIQKNRRISWPAKRQYSVAHFMNAQRTHHSWHATEQNRRQKKIKNKIEMNSAAVQVFLCAVTVTSLWTISMGKSCNFVEQFTLDGQTTCEQSRKQKQTKKTATQQRRILTEMWWACCSLCTSHRCLLNAIINCLLVHDDLIRRNFILLYIINALTLCVNMRRILLSSANVGQQQNRVMNRCHASCMMRRSMIFSFQFFSWQFVWSTHGTFGSNEKLDILLNWPNTKALFCCICKLRSVQFSLLTLSNEQCTLIKCYSIIFQQLAFSTTNRVRPFNMYWMIGHFRVQNCVINVINHYQMINQESLIAATPVKWSRIISIQT